MSTPEERVAKFLDARESFLGHRVGEYPVARAAWRDRLEIEDLEHADVRALLNAVRANDERSAG